MPFPTRFTTPVPPRLRTLLPALWASCFLALPAEPSRGDMEENLEASVPARPVAIPPPPFRVVQWRGEPALRMELPYPYMEYCILLYEEGKGSPSAVMACGPGGWQVSPRGFTSSFREGDAVGELVVLPAGVKVSRLELGDPSDPEVKKLLSTLEWGKCRD